MDILSRNGITTLGQLREIFWKLDGLKWYVKTGEERKAISKIIRQFLREEYDRAQNSNETKTNSYGGIDMNSAQLKLQIQKEGNGVSLNISKSELEQIHLNGLVPIIQRIIPVSSGLVGLVSPTENVKLVFHL